MIFGDAFNDKLSDVWNNNQVLSGIRKGMPTKLTGVCSKCRMNRICNGSCIAMNYYMSRDLFAPFWLCQMAYEKGLFPEDKLLINSA
jgi:radical SAM protein with 4Fe4S-binding SPASM domain